MTLSDVARLAGVSLSTASKALNGKSEVKESTRQLVEQAARDLSFRHNGVARGLSSGKTGIVGLLTSDLEGRFSLPILMGAEDALGAGELSVLLCDARGDAIREQRHLDVLIGRRVDALMVVGSYTDPRPPVTVADDVPVVYVYTPCRDAGTFSLTPDNVQGARLATEHLLSVGRTRIAHITGRRDEQAARDRTVGIERELEEHGLRLAYETAYGEWTERWGRSATAMLLNDLPDVDAIICDSDQIARGALDALRERGRDVPGDIALMGFDNWEIVSGSCSPGITSIDMNLERLGQLAAERLFAVLGGADLPGGTQYEPCRLVVRGSTTPDA